GVGTAPALLASWRDWHSVPDAQRADLNRALDGVATAHAASAKAAELLGASVSMDPAASAQRVKLAGAWASAADGLVSAIDAVASRFGGPNEKARPAASFPDVEVDLPDGKVALKVSEAQGGPQAVLEGHGPI